MLLFVLPQKVRTAAIYFCYAVFLFMLGSGGLVSVFLRHYIKIPCKHTFYIRFTIFALRIYILFGRQPAGRQFAGQPSAFVYYNIHIKLIHATRLYKTAFYCFALGFYRYFGKINRNSLYRISFL